MGPDDRVTEFPGNGPSFIYSTILGIIDLPTWMMLFSFPSFINLDFPALQKEIEDQGSAPKPKPGWYQNNLLIGKP